jgi:hypothetical protein
MEAVGFIISNFLVGLLGFGGSRRKKQLLRGLGLPRAVSFSYGWCSTIGFGQTID